MGLVLKLELVLNCLMPESVVVAKFASKLKPEEPEEELELELELDLLLELELMTYLPG